MLEVTRFSDGSFSSGQLLMQRSHTAAILRKGREASPKSRQKADPGSDERARKGAKLAVLNKEGWKTGGLEFLCFRPVFFIVVMDFPGLGGAGDKKIFAPLGDVFGLVDCESMG